MSQPGEKKKRSLALLEWNGMGDVGRGKRVANEAGGLGGYTRPCTAHRLSRL